LSIALKLKTKASDCETEMEKNEQFLLTPKISKIYKNQSKL